MSTGKRLAKRSIIGTRVCAPCRDGKYYSGCIYAVLPSSSSGSSLEKAQQTRYLVRFDQIIGSILPPPSGEYHENDLIGPGFGSVTSARLVPGQRVFLTYNGREIDAEVDKLRQHQDEVDVHLTISNGKEGKLYLTRRIDEVRLLASRKSARLADQFTDFARLADMAGDRKRAPSHTIDGSHVPGSRKRRQSSGNDSEKSLPCTWSEQVANHRNRMLSSVRNLLRRENDDDDAGTCMDECSAAIVLMSLAASPRSPIPLLPLRNSGQSNSSGRSSSSASWRSSTPSPLLNDCIPSYPSCRSYRNAKNVSRCNRVNNPNMQNYSPTHIVSGESSGSTPGSPGTLDEGVWSDYCADDWQTKKKMRGCNTQRLRTHTPANRRNRVIERSPSSEVPSSDDPIPKKIAFQCTWKGCQAIKRTCPEIEAHVREKHLGPKTTTEDEDCDGENTIVHEEEFYYQEIAENIIMSSPPTMSHRDMARPFHEDPEYQKSIRERPQVISDGIENNMINNGLAFVALNGGVPFNFAAAPAQSPLEGPIRHVKYSASRQQCGGAEPYKKNQGETQKKSRSNTKKCRGRFGIENRDQWCKQCQWKKACTFVDQE